MSRAGQRKQGEAGFSLMETLIGLTLTALIAGSLIGAIRTGTRLWSSSDALDARQEQARLIRLTTSWMENAIPDIEMNTQPGTLFSGEPDALRFVVAGTAGPKDGGFSRIELEKQSSKACPGRSDLVLHWSDVTPGGSYESGERVSRPLLECLNDLRFNYYGTSAADPVLTWDASWKKSDTLPSIIAIRATNADGAFQILARPYLATPARLYVETY